MTPFLLFRRWVRTGPPTERVSVSAVALVAFALVAWAAVPSGSTDHGGAGGTLGADFRAETGPAAVDELAGADGLDPTGGDGSSPLASNSSPDDVTDPSLPDAGTGPASPGTVSSGAGVVAAGPARLPSGGKTGASGPSPTAAARCDREASADEGITNTEIRIAITIPSYQGQAGNSVFGLDSPEVERAEAKAVIDNINAQGGVACRKLVPRFYESNGLDPNQQHSACLDIVQDKNFAALDASFIYTASVRDCLPQHKIPQITSGPLLASEVKDYFPYQFSVWGQWDRILHDYVLGLQQLNWYKGYNKVGLLEASCYPEMNKQLEAELASIGIDKSKTSTYNFGCGSSLPAPTDVAQAVLQFKLDGVTHVMDAWTNFENYFSQQAQQQDYKPKYSLPDGGAITVYQSPGFAPDANNFDGAIAITPTQYGADRTPGIAYSAGTDRCNQAMKDAGLPPVQEQGVSLGGTYCNLAWTLVAALEQAPTLRRADIVNGLHSVGSIDYSYPQGPAVFDRAGVVSGGQFWRPAIYDGSCPCFKVLDPVFRPNFK